MAENGCLLTHLKKTRKNPYVGDTTLDCSQIDKIRIARDVANGMLHLATKRVGDIQRITEAIKKILESDWSSAGPISALIGQLKSGLFMVYLTARVVWARYYRTVLN